MLKMPKVVWLVGKGPSLDKYDWSLANDFVICINETAFVVPKCTFAIAIDYEVLKKYQQQLRPEITVLRKISHVGYVFSKMELWEPPKNMYSTAVIAVQLLQQYGVQVIHFVGFDSIDGNPDYANQIKAVNGEGTNSDCYKGINSQLLKTIERLGIEARWEHRCTSS